MKVKNVIIAALILPIAYCLLPTFSFAQAPQAFKYQSVVRNISGSPMANASVSVRATVRDGSATGTSVYQETHATSTNQFGLFNISIGNGSIVTGTLNSISW